MSITSSGPLCDICGSYILLEPNLIAFSIPAIKGELHCHEKCKPVAANMYVPNLPDASPIKRAYREAGYLNETEITK